MRQPVLLPLENHGFEAPLPKRLQVLQSVPQPGLARNLVSQPGSSKERPEVEDGMYDLQVCSSVWLMDFDMAS
jgi:hypothetical protein